MRELGQLIMTGIKGTSLDPVEAEFLKNSNIGGVILFSQNYEDPAQIAELINNIQKLRDEYPLFVAVDHEGGRVIRFKQHFTQFPAMYQLAQMNSPKYIFEVHALMAKELKSVGVNLNFSPCSDIWTNPENKVIGDRSFGHDIETVEKFISAAIRGLQTNGIMSCAKHFPGHGDTLKDSHFDLPLIKKSLDEMRQREIQPFIKATKSRVEFMMMAHLLIDSIDTEFPTTVSPKAYKFLRDETRFSKVVITDDMEMKAIADKYSIEQAGVMALNAGADIILYRFAEDAMKVYEALSEAYKSKTIKKENLLEKWSRIELLKKQYLKDYQPTYIPKISEVFSSTEGKNLLKQYEDFLSKKV